MLPIFRLCKKGENRIWPKGNPNFFKGVCFFWQNIFICSIPKENGDTRVSCDFVNVQPPSAPKLELCQLTSVLVSQIEEISCKFLAAIVRRGNDANHPRLSLHNGDCKPPPGNGAHLQPTPNPAPPNPTQLMTPHIQPNPSNPNVLSLHQYLYSVHRFNHRNRQPLGLENIFWSFLFKTKQDQTLPSPWDNLDPKH